MIGLNEWLNSNISNKYRSMVQIKRCSLNSINSWKERGGDYSEQNIRWKFFCQKYIAWLNLFCAHLWSAHVFKDTVVFGFLTERKLSEDISVDLFLCHVRTVFAFPVSLITLCSIVCHQNRIYSQTVDKKSNAFKTIFLISSAFHYHLIA